MKINNNRIVLDLNKVQWAKYYWINQYGDMRHTDVTVPTVHSEPVFNSEYAAYHPDYPFESMYERALRLLLLDIWTPVCYMQLTANHSVTFTGKKATTMWKMWCNKILNRKNKT